MTKEPTEWYIQGNLYIRPEWIVTIYDDKPTIVEKTFNWLRALTYSLAVLVMPAIGTVAAIRDPQSFAIGFAIGMATGAR